MSRSPVETDRKNGEQAPCLFPMGNAIYAYKISSLRVCSHCSRCFA